MNTLRRPGISAGLSTLGSALACALASTLAPALAPIQALAATPVASAAAAAVELRLDASQDASIYQGDDSIADGAGPHLWTSVLAIGLNRRALLRFDVSGIPAGARVQSVTLQLNQSRSRDNHDVALHKLLAAWSEGPANGGSGGVGAPTATGDTTWSYRRWPDLRWARPGGDYVPQASSRQFVGLPDSVYAWTGPGLVADVQAWVDRPDANHGWILIGREDGNQVAKRFDSRENGDPALRPRLTVSYLPPDAVAANDADVPLPPWALATLAAGLAAALARRRPGRTGRGPHQPGP